MGVTLSSKYSVDYDMGYASFYRFRQNIAKYVDESPKSGTISFLEQCDCEGKLTYKECKELINDIENMKDDGELFGYVGRGADNCLTITKFKELLKSCYSHRCNLIWY